MQRPFATAQHRIRAWFYGQDVALVVDGRNPRVGGITAFQHSKAFGEAAGTFTLTLKRKLGSQPSFLSHFSDPEDVFIRVQWLKNGRLYDGLWGLSDSMSETTVRTGNGERIETITVTGRDTGKVFAMMDLFVNIHEQGAARGSNTASLPMIPIYTEFNKNLIGSPDQMVRSILAGWIGNNGVADKQWLLPPSLQPEAGSSYFYDWLDQSKISPDLRGVTYDPSLLNVEGQGRKLWDTLQEYSNPLLNEMWVDLAVDPAAPANRRYEKMRPALFLRERPHPTIKSNERWNSIPRHRLRIEDIKMRSTVSDGTERFNYWLLRATSAQGDDFAVQALIQESGGPRVGQPGNVPIYDLDSIRKHGLRRFEQSTRYLPINHAVSPSPTKPGQSADPDVDWLSVGRQWVRMVHDWYVTAPQQYTGTITTTTAFPEIRIGCRLIEERYDEDDWEYYVEGVDHEYSYPDTASTTLHLTRGQPVGANYLQLQYYKYGGYDLPTLTEQDATQARITEQEDIAISQEGGSDLSDANSIEARTEASRTEALTTTSAIDGSPALASLVSMEGVNTDVTPPAPEEAEPVTPADMEGVATPTTVPESQAGDPTSLGGDVPQGDTIVLPDEVVDVSTIRRRVSARRGRGRPVVIPDLGDF